MEDAEKLKILIVHNSYRLPGGEDAVVSNEKKILEKNGHRVIFYHRSNREIDKFNLLQKIMFPFTVIFNIKTYRDIKRIIKIEQIDIVHVHNTLSIVSPAVYYAAIRRGIPVVQTIHNFRILCPGAIFFRDGHICTDCLEKGLMCAVRHSCYRGSRLQTLVCVLGTVFHRIAGIYGKLNYICLTDFYREKMQTLKQIKPDRVFIKPNFVNSDENIVPRELRKNQFLFAGRLDSFKGMDIVLGAWKIMGDSAPLLIICGTGPREEWCRNFITKNRLKNVEMRGYVSNEEVRQLLGISKGMIFASQCYEGFPLSLAESYAAGTPVIGPDIGNVKDIITKYGMGEIFKHDSSEDLAKKIMQKDLFMGFEHSKPCAVSDEQINYNMLMEIYGKV